MPERAGRKLNCSVRRASEESGNCEGIALESVQPSGPTPRVLDSRSSRSVEVGGAYRVVGNLNVTAGVRLSQERDRLTPLTDGVEDSQAVYVGTQLRF